MSEEPPRPSNLKLCPVEGCGKPGWLGVASEPSVVYCEQHAPGWEDMRETFRKALASKERG
jgi:hypothetical protein